MSGLHDCERYDIMLNAYVDGALSDTDREALEAHLRDCAECRSYLELLRTVHTELREDLPQPPKKLAEGIMYKIGLEQRRRRFAYGRWTAIAAVLCIAVFGVVRLSGNTMKASNKADTAMTMCAADTDTGSTGSTGGGSFYEEMQDEAPAENRFYAYTDGADPDCADSAPEPEPEMEVNAAADNSYDCGSLKSSTDALPGYDIAMEALEGHSYYSVCVFYRAPGTDFPADTWEPLSAADGLQCWLVPASDLQNWEDACAFDEIYYGDQTAENSLVVILTEMED